MPEDIPVEPSAAEVLRAEKERMEELVVSGHSLGVSSWNYAVDRLAQVSKSLAYFDRRGKDAQESDI